MSTLNSEPQTLEQFPWQATVKRRGPFPSRSVEGEGIVVSTEKGEAILLNGSGFALWSWIDDQRNAGQLLDLLCEQYAVTPEAGKHDLQQFLTRLTDLKLVELI